MINELHSLVSGLAAASRAFRGVYDQAKGAGEAHRLALGDNCAIPVQALADELMVPRTTLIG